MPWGEIESDELGANTRLFGRFRDVKDLQNLPIARLNKSSGRVVRLEEVADVRRDLERETSRAFLSWEGDPYKQSIEISLTKVPASDTLDSIQNAKAALEEIRQSNDWPHGLEYRITSDQSNRIWESLLRVFNNGWQAMICVFVVLLLMLSWREALIAGLSIPLAFLGAMTVIWMLGYTLNEMVLIGMVLALGLLVDVFILMMEGLHEGIFVEHLSWSRSAMWTIKRFALPAFAGQMTTVLALAPLIAVSGTPGKFIRILPVTTISCLVLSFIVALLVDVPLSRFLLGRMKTQGQERKTLVDRLTIWVSAHLANWSLKNVVRNKFVALMWTGGVMGLFVLAAMVFSTLPQTMYTERDGRNLGVTIELPAGTTLETSQECADLVGEILRKKPFLESAVKLVGQKSPLVQGSLGEALAPSSADYLLGFSCQFTERNQRDKPAFEYVDDLRDEIQAVLENHYPGASMQLMAETGRPEASDPVQVQIIGDDMNVLRDLSKQAQAALKTVPGAVEVRDNLGNVKVDIKLLPKREALDFYEITHEELASQIRYAMGDQEIGKFAIGGVEEDLEIRLGTAWPSREGKLGGPTRMDELVTVRAFQPDGGTVPVMAVVTPQTGTSPISITRQDGQRSITVSSKNHVRLPSEVLADFTPKLDELQKTWPSGYRYRIGGEAEESAEAFSSAGSAMVVALFLVFALLVLLFGSFSQPFIIVLTIPMGLIGTFFGFFLMGMPFSFLAMIGIISLIGIVVNDAIVMVETMNEYFRRGAPLAEAAARGGADRLRPVLSTSLTTMMGLIPLALSDPMWEPLCAAIIFGLIASTVFSLLVIPALFVLLTREKESQLTAITE